MATKYDVEKIRKKLQEKKGSRFKDVNEFRPPKVKEGETLRFRFFILPPLAEGDKTADGEASASMDVFYVQNGSHWINNRPHACPRVHDEKECPICELGFGMMSETEDKKKRSGIAKQFLPRTQHAVNIYFPQEKTNPEEYRGKVMWMNASKQIFDIWEACIMNDNAGDPEDPQACGVFYDENAAYLFQLEIKENNKYNEYKTSKFLASIGKVPISKKPEKVAEILTQRHDLFTKFQERDMDSLKKIVAELQSGGGTSDDSGFDEDEAAEQPKSGKTGKPASVETEAEDDDLAGLGEDVAPKTSADAPKAKAKEADVEDDELQSLLNEIETSDD